MCIGIGCFAEKVDEDEKYVLYAYGAFNWNDFKSYNDEKIMDGEILIEKAPFLSDVKASLFIDKKIQIKNSRFCPRIFKSENDASEYGAMALSWIYKLSCYMKEHYEFPMKLSICK